MKKKDAITWGEALVSGEYKQCQNKLSKTDNEGSKSYCCLGVATEVLMKDSEAKRDALSNDSGANELERQGVFISSFPTIYNRGAQFHQLNDSDSESFETIGTFVLLGAESGICEEW
jgi:hypothetical protein